jgi:glutathione synthase/RimK-type ligase-like ATP-grasp enzyme
VVEPTGLRDLAVRATAALGYSLGAVDIAFNEHHNQLVVFEVNAAPGMQGSTLENYANTIVEWYKGVER